MIQPQELRIGNWAKTINDVPLKILTVGLHACQCQYDGTQNTEEEGKRISTIGFDSINPIPLTPEILVEKLLLEYADVFGAYFSNDFPLILEHKNDAFIIQKFDEWTSIFQPIRYLHQLQNLYYALAGTELSISLGDKEAVKHTITASDLYNTKIRVTPEESERVQKKAFELGYKWIVEGQKVSFVNAYYLLFSNNKLILYMKWDEGIDFMAHKFKEITLKDILG